MIVGTIKNGKYLTNMRESHNATLKKNGSFIDIHFNYCGEDIWIALPAGVFRDNIQKETKTIVTYDFPLSVDDLMDKIKKLKSWNEVNNETNIKI